MLLASFDPRLSRLIRLIGLGLVTWSVVTAHHGPSLHGRGLAAAVLLVISVCAWFSWTARPDIVGPPPLGTYCLAGAGGALLGACPGSAASVFAFVAIVTGGLRTELTRAWSVAALATFALAVTVLIWDGSAVGLLAYGLGFAAAALAAANARQARERADEAELLLAQTQRSAEEQMRVARLQESTRIAREIHDVLAHALAGLTIQLEATTALIENGAMPEEVLARVRRAHELARDGLRETRRAVGALRGDRPSVPEAIGALAAEHPAELTLTGDAACLDGEAGLTVLRVVQEALTNVSKHAPGAEVSIVLSLGEEIVVVVENRLAGMMVAAGSLQTSGGGYGIVGMSERAQALGGTLEAGRTGGGWRVRLRLPVSPVKPIEPIEPVDREAAR